jgi:glutamate synthase domain-containing protein 2
MEVLITTSFHLEQCRECKMIEIKFSQGAKPEDALFYQKKNARWKLQIFVGFQGHDIISPLAFRHLLIL